MTRKNDSFEGYPWFKFNNLGLALAMTLKFCSSVVKELKVKFKRFWGIFPTILEVTRKKLVEGSILLPPILNRVEEHKSKHNFENCFNPNCTCCFEVNSTKLFFLHYHYFSALHISFTTTRHNSRFFLKTY